MRIRTPAVLGFAALAICACRAHPKSGSDAAAASTPPAAVLEAPASATTPLKAAVPLAFNQKTPDAQVRLTIAQPIAHWPALHREVYAKAVADLRKFAAEAKTDRDGMKGQQYQPGLYERQLDWTLAAATPRVVSLQQTWYADTGGAHPNHGYDTYLWDAAANRSIANAALFQASDDAVIQKAFCDAIDKAKRAKGADWDPESWPCPKWRESHFVLAPSTTPGKIGGLVFLFDPYEVGSYAEGEYEAVLPQALFAGVLAPAYASEFAGAPKPRPAPPA